jgi:predicted RNA binding protein YcfA (HicA-like mRNA interferase family)
LGRLGVFSGQEICRILRQHGFVEVRHHGSHSVMQKRDGGMTVTVPVPLHSTLKTGTLRSIVRQSGLPRSVFEVER